MIQSHSRVYLIVDTDHRIYFSQRRRIGDTPVVIQDSKYTDKVRL